MNYTQVTAIMSDLAESSPIYTSDLLQYSSQPIVSVNYQHDHHYYPLH